MRLGIDTESPEAPRYLLIGTFPLTLVLALALIQLGHRSARQFLIAASCLGVIMCVPLESLGYVIGVSVAAMSLGEII